MSEAIKFSPEEMKQLSDLQQTYINLQNNLGQISVQRIKLEQQINDLDNAEDQVRKNFNITQETEKKLIERISAKYGDGNLDINTGVFTPKPVEDTTEKTL